MSRQFIEGADSVRFKLQTGTLAIHIMESEPIGWKDDALEIIRNKQYHGVFIQFSGGLKFIGEAGDFIRRAYDDFGINVNLYLIKEVLLEEDSYKSNGDSVVKWVEEYRGIADALTLNETLDGLSISFNSNELETLVKTHEGDDFGISRDKSIDNKGISDYSKISVDIKSRDISGIGEHKERYEKQSGEFKLYIKDKNLHLNRIGLETVFITKAIPRHVEVNSQIYYGYSHNQDNMFYNDVLSGEDGGDSLNLKTKLKLRIKGSMRLYLGRRTTSRTSAYVCLQRWEYDRDANDYIAVKIDGSPQSGRSTYRLSDSSIYNRTISFDKNLSFEYGDIKHTTSFSIVIQVYNLNNPTVSKDPTVSYTLTTHDYNVKLDETTVYEIDKTYNASFVNDVASRLLEIITGRKNKFYSKLFGRELSYLPTDGELPYQDYIYEKTGEHGHVSLIHGMDIRAFEGTEELYKDLTTSFKGLVDSLSATFNIGMGIENSMYGQRVRFERLEYFFQPTVALKLEGTIELKSRKVDKSMFYSACEFGGSKGGEYEEEIGLDEPNVKSSYVTPLRKTSKKYNHLSKIRSDEYGMELLRRFPAILNNKEDRSGDDHIWYLDLKWEDLDENYTQLDWQDVLVSVPEGVQSPDTYHNWKFTPKRALLRHGWVMRAGMEVLDLQQKEFSMINSNSNINLSTQYIGEPKPVAERENVKVESLNRSLILPEEISFKHPVTREMIKLLYGTTSILVEGSLENVPNWYFQVQFTNERGAIERGYIKSIKPNKSEWVLWKANDNTLF